MSILWLLFGIIIVQVITSNYVLANHQGNILKRTWDWNGPRPHPPTPSHPWPSFTGSRPTRPGPWFPWPTRTPSPPDSSEEFQSTGQPNSNEQTDSDENTETTTTPESLSTETPIIDEATDGDEIINLESSSTSSTSNAPEPIIDRRRHRRRSMFNWN